MAERKISYTTRDFAGIRTELINFVRTYYPDTIDNFNDASIFSVFLDLNVFPPGQPYRTTIHEQKTPN